ncbi:uncharacterized protein LOC105842975 [Bombyx mori]|uniref:Uncharacterized protein n=1 Tax=Bombyx mori TaxID=7091 RepID=A0A8R2CAB5_BOMMO|nr:uncharacterized protein LOC105842975 [Bombyx mori]
MSRIVPQAVDTTEAKTVEYITDSSLMVTFIFNERARKRLSVVQNFNRLALKTMNIYKHYLLICLLLTWSLAVGYKILEPNYDFKEDEKDTNANNEFSSNYEGNPILAVYPNVQPYVIPP